MNLDVNEAKQVLRPAIDMVRNAYGKPLYPIRFVEGSTPTVQWDIEGVGVTVTLKPKKTIGYSRNVTYEGVVQIDSVYGRRRILCKARTFKTTQKDLRKKFTEAVEVAKRAVAAEAQRREDEVSGLREMQRASARLKTALKKRGLKVSPDPRQSHVLLNLYPEDLEALIRVLESK